MTPGFPALASPPKSLAPAFARLTAPARTPALPPAAGRARFGFAACYPYFPILRGPALRKAQGHIPPAQHFSYLSLACLTPVRKVPRYFILARAARLSLDSLPALFILRPALSSPISRIAHLPPLTDASFVSLGCRRPPMHARPQRVRIRSCLPRASLARPPLLLRLACTNPSTPPPS